MHDGITHPHEHPHSHPHETHGHVHTEEETRAVINRLSRAAGHIESIKRMVEDGRDCSEVLVQLAAVRSAVNNVGKLIMQSHLEHCIVQAVQNNEPSRIEALKHAIDKFIR